MNTTDALKQIIDYKEAVARATHDLRHTVAAARAAGASWSDIGAQLGISKQAAQQQYADAAPNTYRCNCGWSIIVPLDDLGCSTATQLTLDHIHDNHPKAGK